MSGKVRLDRLVVERGLAESRERAQRLILEGAVLVDGRGGVKAGHLVAPDAEVRLKEKERFVSRGGWKLEGAFRAFGDKGWNVEGKRCVDVGASTGGFTDCLLQHGARAVVAVDVGKGQLHPRVAGDARVEVRDGVNARHLAEGDLGEPAEAAVTDVSFISLKLILPAIDRVLAPGGQTVALIKPQFEAGRADVGRGGVVRDEAVRARVVAEVREFGERKLGWEWLGCEESPLRGAAGNVEYLSWWRKPER